MISEKKQTVIENEGNLKRLRYIDVGRGIGMMLVVLGHTVNPGSLLWKAIFAFHMPLFFMLSGYLYKQRDKATPLRCIFAKRFVELMPS